MRIRAREPLAAASDKARITKSDRHDVKKKNPGDGEPSTRVRLGA
jgi:hypothetical protein